MKIKNINITNQGHVICKSNFYSAIDVISKNISYNFSSGINKLVGDIDSGKWAISYLLSMHKHRPKDFILFDQPNVTVNGMLMSLNELSDFSCYMDTLHPLFSETKSVKNLVEKGLKHSESNYSIADIKDLFCIDAERFNRPLKGVGNEIFKAMAAIGFSHKKELFCFPWLSARRFEGYHENLSTLLQILKNLEKTVIIPIGALVDLRTV